MLLAVAAHTIHKYLRILAFFMHLDGSADGHSKNWLDLNLGLYASYDVIFVLFFHYLFGILAVSQSIIRDSWLLGWKAQGTCLLEATISVVK
jgi:hypothetical protein